MQGANKSSRVNGRMKIWLYDGNVPFLQGKRIALFLHDGPGCHGVLHPSILSIIMAWAAH